MVKSKKNPYKKMMSNVRMSSQNAGSTRKVADTHKRELKVGKKGELYREHKQHFVDITWEDLEKQFKKQNGRCYYLPNYKIDLDLFLTLLDGQLHTNFLQKRAFQ